MRRFSANLLRIGLTNQVTEQFFRKTMDIREVRKSLGITQRQLAKKLGWENRRVSNAENLPCNDNSEVTKMLEHLLATTTERWVYLAKWMVKRDAAKKLSEISQKRSITVSLQGNVVSWRKATGQAGEHDIGTYYKCSADVIEADLCT